MSFRFVSNYLKFQETPPPNRAESTSRRNSSALPGPFAEDVTQEMLPSDNETVNFNLDVKVNITSGTCTVRTGKKEGSMQLPLRKSFGIQQFIWFFFQPVFEIL